MKQFLIDLVSENSKISTMRVMALLCVLAAIGLAAYGIHEDKSMDGLSMLVGVFLGAAFSGKVMQKSRESK